MSIYRFVDRKEELKKLGKLKKLGIIFGRRRVGKTRLLKEFLKNKKAIYFLVINKDLKINLERFSKQCSKKFNIPGLRFEDFKEMFEFLNSREDIEIIAIDEFGYLVKFGVLPEFQEIIDEILKKKLILTGSTISLMEEVSTSYKSPIYGRADLILHLQPLKFEYIFEWFNNISFEDALKIYAVTNNVPRYLEFFSGRNVENEIIENFFSQTFLFYDARKLLQEELIESERYFRILEAIANGKITLSEIRNCTGIEYQSLPFYIDRLRRLKIIKKVLPIFGRKKGIYKITDKYFHFWFRFVYPFEDEIDSLFPENAISYFKNNFNSYLGLIFEDLIETLFKEKFLEIFPFTKIGKWWYKDKEIDIVALNEHTKEILFAECKWSDNVDAEKICKELIKKSKYVQWYNDERKEYFAIFAKSFKKKIDEFEGRKVHCFNLKDLERIIRK